MPICGRVVSSEIQPISRPTEIIVNVAPATMVGSFERILASAFNDAITIEQASHGQFGMAIHDPARMNDVEQLLTVLKNHVTIDDTADESHALRVNRYMDRKKRSDVGEITHSLKYGERAAQFQALDDLLEHLYPFIEAHPLYLSAAVIAAAPPSALWRPNPPQLVADRLAEEYGMRKLRITSPDRAQRKMKNDEDEVDCTDIEGQFRVEGSVDGATVLLIDDFYHGGCTVNECVRALKQAGAGRVLALTAVKNATHCDGLDPSWEKWATADEAT